MIAPHTECVYVNGMTALDMPAALIGLAKTRPLFHSEADFQHALAWQLRESGMVDAVRLEKPEEIDGRRIHVDLLARTPEGWVGIELKYWTCRSVHEYESERYDLRDQSAQDACRYDYWSDVALLEYLVAKGRVVEGWVIALSNESLFWRQGRRVSNDEEFRLTESRNVTGELMWGPKTGEGSRRARPTPVSLARASEPLDHVRSPALVGSGRRMQRERITSAIGRAAQQLASERSRRCRPTNSYDELTS